MEVAVVASDMDGKTLPFPLLPTLTESFRWLLKPSMFRWFMSAASVMDTFLGELPSGCNICYTGPPSTPHPIELPAAQ